MSEKVNTDTDEWDAHSPKVTGNIRVLIAAIIANLVWLGLAVGIDEVSLRTATLGVLGFALSLNGLASISTWANSFYEDHFSIRDENLSTSPSAVRLRLSLRKSDHDKYLYRQASLFLLGALAIARVAADEPILGLFIKGG